MSHKTFFPCSELNHWFAALFSEKREGLHKNNSQTVLTVKAGSKTAKIKHRLPSVCHGRVGGTYQKFHLYIFKPLVRKKSKGCMLTNWAARCRDLIETPFSDTVERQHLQGEVFTCELCPTLCASASHMLLC